jgi:hypothetical protein
VSPPRWNASKSSYVEGERHAAQVLVVPAFGALTYEIEHRRLDLDALRHESDAVGGTLGGLELAEALIADAGERRSVLPERRPYGTPNDWVAVGSRPLFDEYERKVREIGTRFDPQLDANDARLLRRQMEAICVAAASPLRVRTLLPEESNRLRNRDALMNIAPAPIERPHRVGVDHLSDYQCDCVRQAEAAVASLQRRGIVSDGGTDRNRLAAVCEVSGGR